MAALRGHLEVVECLVANGADVNSLDWEKKSSLYGAASNGHLQVVQLLIDKGADVNATDKRGITPLHGAAFFGHEAVVRYLLEHGADTTLRTSRDGDLPIDGARLMGHDSIVGLLLQAVPTGAGRLVCPLCGEVYLVGQDACVISLGNMFAFMGGQGTAIIGNADGMAASTPDLVGRLIASWSKAEREERLEETQANMERVRAMIQSGQHPQWECHACQVKEHPNPYPEDF